jgi:hypothetical protein
MFIVYHVSRSFVRFSDDGYEKRKRFGREDGGSYNRKAGESKK